MNSGVIAHEQANKQFEKQMISRSQGARPTCLRRCLFWTMDMSFVTKIQFRAAEGRISAPAAIFVGIG
jgi:hypothetical protein